MCDKIWLLILSIVFINVQLISLISSNPIDQSLLNSTSELPKDVFENRSLISIIDHILSFGDPHQCATAQGQAGICTVGRCPNLGNFSSIGCNGLSSFMKCCPLEEAVERYPLQIPNLSIDCGQRLVQPGSLIVGGKESDPYTWPWAVALYRVRNGRKIFQCGASIISDRYILTAAHCVVRNKEKSIDPKNFVVKVGAHDLRNSGVFKLLDAVIVHENYNAQYHNDDIALLRLKISLDFENELRVGPVCLPSPGSDMDIREGTPTTMIGWGLHDPMDFTPSSQLYQVTVPVYNKEECRQTYTKLLNPNNYFDFDNVICAAHREGGKDTCQGDSGGPMLLSMPNGQHYQIGIVSFGYGCAKKGYPGVYTYVPNYLKWIGAHMD
ncbi:putative serine hydrolase [Sarcoptes scabiei]|nr:putative serine hydrolase [Sarcoptes scabiei]